MPRHRAIATLAGCGSSDSSEGTSGGTLTAGFDNEPVTLDPALSSAISSDRNVLNLFFDTLLRQRRDGTFEPALATQWTDTGTGITFELRQGVKFHDGTPFDADAVVLNLKRISDPATRSTKTAALASVREVKAIGPRTVSVTLKAPDPLLLTQLAHEPGMIASPTALAKGAEEFGRRPVGTGPFTFRQWRTKVQLTAERNKTYWAKSEEGDALPFLDKVVLRFVTEAKVLRAELSTGGVHLVRALPPEEYKQLAEAPRITIKDEGVRRNYYASLNVTKGPFRDPQVRAAFAMAVERRSVGKAAAGGDFDIAPSFATSDDWFYDDALAPCRTTPRRPAPPWTRPDCAERYPSPSSPAVAPPTPPSRNCSRASSPRRDSPPRWRSSNSRPSWSACGSRTSTRRSSSSTSPVWTPPSPSTRTSPVTARATGRA